MMDWITWMCDGGDVDWFGLLRLAGGCVLAVVGYGGIGK